MDDNVSFLLNHGMTLDEIQHHIDNGLPLDEVAHAAKSLIDSGKPLIDADFGNAVHSVQEWDKPIPFSSPNTPDFPVSALPAPVEAFVDALAESTQTPPEMSGILSLGILATAFQARHEVEITPGWKEPLCLYPVAVAPPGERKSAVISALSAPVYEYERERQEFETVELAQNQAEKRLLEKALQAAENAVGKKGDITEQRQKVLDLSAQLANFKELHPFRLMADDTTPEKLVDIMEMQGGCITVASAEGGVFDSLQGRYERAANLDIYLKGHAGDTISVDRIGRKSNYIANPRLTMMLTIQPAVLHGLMDNSNFRGRGLCGRFLYAMCKSKVGQREVSPAPMSGSIRAEYRQFVRQILASQGSGIVRLSDDADTVRKDYHAYIEKKLGGEWEHMRDWGGKLVGTMARIAALLHLSSFPSDMPISAETIVAAIRIAEFLGAHAEVAYQAMGADDSIEDAKYILKRLISEGRERVTRTELTRLCRGKFAKADDMRPALETLIDHYYIREIENDVGYNNRKQAAYLINPAVLRK